MGRDRGRDRGDRGDRGRGSSQAELLRARGDVRTTTLSFEVRLSAPGVRARPKADPMSRLGLHLRRTQESVPLEVAEVDQRIGQFTPVAQWNFREVQRAHRGSNERRASRDIKPGDKILAVNGAEVDGAMLLELQSAASMSSPKDLDIRLQREMLDVFGPQPDRADRADDSEKRDSLGSLSSATWSWKPPKPEKLDKAGDKPEQNWQTGPSGRGRQSPAPPSSRHSTRSADDRRSDSHGARSGVGPLLIPPQYEGNGRRAISAEPYTSPTARNSRSRGDVGMSTLNQAARSMLHC